jgi:hypothetical protein
MALGSQGGISTPNASEASQFVVKDFNFAADRKSASDLASEDGITFTRATTARYNNSSGNLVEQSSGEPVYEYSGATSLGLRVEKGTTNKIKHSSTIDPDSVNQATTGWGGDNSSTGGGGYSGGLAASGHITGPDGVSDSGKKIIGVAGTMAGTGEYNLLYNLGWYGSSPNADALSGSSFSFYAKAGNTNFVGASLVFGADPGDNVGGCVNLATGAVTSVENCSASTEDVGDGWYRCKFENCQFDTGASYFSISFGSAFQEITTDRPPDGAGEGGSAFDANRWVRGASYHSRTGGSIMFNMGGVDWWTGYTIVPYYFYTYGWQAEDSAVCTSYVPTGASEVARAADVASVTGSDFSDFYNQTQGTFAVEGRRNKTASTTHAPTLLEVNDGVSENIGFTCSDSKEQLLVREDNTTRTTVDAGTAIAKNTDFKIAGAYKSGNYGVSLNGIAAEVDATSQVPTPDQMVIGKSANLGGGAEMNNRELNGFVSRIRYWRRRVSDAFLKKLST